MSARQRERGGQKFIEDRKKYSKQYINRVNTFAKEYASKNKILFDSVLKTSNKLIDTLSSGNHNTYILRHMIYDILIPIVTNLENTFEYKTNKEDTKFNKTISTKIIAEYIKLLSI